MNRLDYYKSLISDREVVKALVNESKHREAKRLRIRPNVKFLRRTVYDIMSSNERIDVQQQKIIKKEKQKSPIPIAKAEPTKRKNFKKLVRDILSERPRNLPDTDDDVTYVTTYKQLPSGNKVPDLPATPESCDKTKNTAIVVLDDSDDSSSDSDESLSSISSESLSCVSSKSLSSVSSKSLSSVSSKSLSSVSSVITVSDTENENSNRIKH